jgi:hypothetical protein
VAAPCRRRSGGSAGVVEAGGAMPGAAGSDLRNDAHFMYQYVFYVLVHMPDSGHSMRISMYFA